jgi:DhnA family fructose-bisphosphate aldolase class Ia
LTAIAESYEFVDETFLPPSIFYKITEARVSDPGMIEKSAKRRRLRDHLTNDGKLAILAADHPARRVTKSGNDSTMMGNRHGYLARALRVVSNPEFDGVMGTTDIIEDLLIVDQLMVENGGESFLDEKVLIGCMNRGGLSGAEFEMDDRFTSFTAESIHNLRLDGGKMMFRLDIHDTRSLDTIIGCARAINELNKHSIPVFLEAFSVERTAEGYRALKSADELIKTIGVATALGDSSRRIWLKIPHCESFDRVAKSTTCPILMLGGESLGDLSSVFREFCDGMAAGRNVRGALVGRNVLYPGREDPAAVAGAVNRLVHEKFTVEQAVDHVASVRGRNMNKLTSVIA